MNFILWLGAICLSICAVPAAWTTWQRKSVQVSWLFLGLWGFGELASLIWAIWSGNMPLSVNYSVNLLCIGILWKYNK